MFSWQQKKLPQRQREPCLAPTRRMRFKISLLSTMSILKKKPVTAMRHTLQTLKDGVASLPTAMKSSSSTPTQQSIKQSCTLSHTIKTPAHDDVLAMQASIDSSTPIATADTSIDGQANNIVELSPPFSSTSIPSTPAAQQQSTSPKLQSAFCTPTKSNKKRLSADDAIIDQLTSPVFNNTCITSSSASSSSPGMLMWPFDETSSNAKEQMSKKQTVDATSSSPLLVSSPTMKTQATLDLLELPFFTEASPIIAKQQDSKKSASDKPSPSPSISNEEQTNKTLSPIRCTLPSPDIGNTTSNVQMPSSPTPALQHSANASALWIVNDECTKTSTSSKSKLLSFSNKKSNMMSNPRTPLSPLALANNTKKQSVTNALVSSKTPPPTSVKSTSTSTSKHASLANKSNVPTKNTFKAPAPISKRKRNGNSSNDSSKISPTYNIENYFIKSKAASINEGTTKKKENTATTTTSSLASSLQKTAFHSTPSLFCSATSESTTKKDADGFCRPPSIKRKRSGIEDNAQSCSFLKRKVLPLATRSHTMPNPSTSNDSDDDVFLSVSTSLQQRQRRDTRRLSSPQLGLNEQVMRKRTRVSVHTNGGIYKPRYAERSLSESAVNHIGACHSSAPHTPPSTRRCSSPSNPIESTKNATESQEQPSSTTSQTIVHGSDSFMSPMSRRIIAAAGMRRFGETMPMDMLKSNLVNPFL
ncbi:hypothetical protein BDF22DRAFT_742831 [Syncephalis plumigaleata]|nr:hypothetical protein BDF22DRAFT_742831 [Syncephalis plumigaleata]